MHVDASKVSPESPRRVNRIGGRRIMSGWRGIRGLMWTLFDVDNIIGGTSMEVAR
jgi:hypothetical protein